MPDISYGRLYNRAFQGSSDFPRNGARPGVAPNALRGAISDFEMSLFVGAHEATHLLGNMDEVKADWYGIYVVLEYRKDGGKRCAKMKG